MLQQLPLPMRQQLIDYYYTVLIMTMVQLELIRVHLLAVDLSVVAQHYYMISQKNWALLPLTLMINYLH